MKTEKSLLSGHKCEGVSHGQCIHLVCLGRRLDPGRRELGALPLAE